MSLDIQKQNLFSTLYGSDPCEEVKVSQSTIDFIRQHILTTQPVQQPLTQSLTQPLTQPLTQSLQPPQTTSSLACRWKTDSEQYSGNLKL